MLMKSFRLFLPCFILVACENNDDLNELRTEIALTEIKLALASANFENNLITGIDVDDRSFRIQFESGDPIAVQTQWIEGVLYDSAAWLATFQFHDNTHQSANFVGRLDFDAEDIILNPYLTSPLTALADIRTPVKGKFKVSVRGRHGSSDRIRGHVESGKGCVLPDNEGGCV